MDLRPPAKLTDSSPFAVPAGCGSSDRRRRTGAGASARARDGTAVRARRECGARARVTIRRLGHRDPMADHRRNRAPGRHRGERHVVSRALARPPHLLLQGQSAAPRIRGDGENVREERQRLLRHRAGEPRRHLGARARGDRVAHGAVLADPLLDPRRLRHQLPTHHGRRGRSPGSRSRGRGCLGRSRRTVADSRHRPRRASSRSATPGTRRRGRRYQCHRAAAGRNRIARRYPGRRVRARARGRGSRTLPRDRRAIDRSGDFQPDLHGGIARRSRDARPGELRGDDADARVSDRGI